MISYASLINKFGDVWFSTPDVPWAMAEHMSQSPLNRTPTFSAPVDGATEGMYVGDGNYSYVVGNVGVIPVSGPMVAKGKRHWGTSYEFVTKAARQFRNNPNVKAVVLDIDTNGGTALGIETLTAELRDLRNEKPLYTYATRMYSAGYFFGSAAHKIILSRTSGAGSIGVISVIPDFSGALEKEGIKVHFFRSMPGKARPSGLEPVTDADAARITQQVQRFHRIFADNLKLNRNMDEDQITELNGETRDGDAAVNEGLADGLGSLETTIAAAQAAGDEATEQQAVIVNLAEQLTAAEAANADLTVRLEASEGRIVTMTTEVAELHGTIATLKGAALDSQVEEMVIAGMKDGRFVPDAAESMRKVARDNDGNYTEAGVTLLGGVLAGLPKNTVAPKGGAEGDMHDMTPENVTENSLPQYARDWAKAAVGKTS